MKQIEHCDWVPERARWSYIARSGVPAVSYKKNLIESQTINPLLTKLFRSRWLHIGLIQLITREYDSTDVKKFKRRLSNFPESQTINPVLTKLFRSRWLHIGLRQLITREYDRTDVKNNKSVNVICLPTVH